MNFVPNLSEIDQDKDKRIENLAKTIADCTTINKAATALMYHEPWDFTAVYYDSIDHFCHGFMNYHPPRLSWVNKKDFELYKLVVESGYIYHDILLETLLDKTDENTTVIIISDHGFHSDHLRPRHIPMEPAGPAVQHRPYGIFAVKGPGIKKDEIIYGASLLDICPTILTLFGSACWTGYGRQATCQYFCQTRQRYKSFQAGMKSRAKMGRHPPDKRLDPVETREAMQQLISLGYIEKPAENREKAIEETIRELHYNLARSYMDAGQYGNAIPTSDGTASSKWPDEYRFGIQLVTLLSGNRGEKGKRAFYSKSFSGEKKRTQRKRQRN